MENKFLGVYKASELLTDMGDRFAFCKVEDVLKNEKNKAKRKSAEEMAVTKLKVTEEKVYVLTPLPNGLTADDAEVKEAVAAGMVTLMDGMMADEGKSYELREDGIYCEEPFGNKVTKMNTDVEGELVVFAVKYVRE